jgi:hypothetical protein
MARAQSQYMRIYSITNITYHRFQNYYGEQTVSFGGNNWQYLTFSANGFTAGISGDETNVTITAPATTLVMQAFEPSIAEGRLVDLEIYQFNTLFGNDSPQAGQQLVAAYTGQIVGGSGGLTSMTLKLGSALSPVGAQIPPRKFTTQVMGAGARL